MCAKHLFVFPYIAQECGLSLAQPLHGGKICSLGQGKCVGVGGALIRLFTNELWRQLQEWQILLLSSPTLWSCRVDENKVPLSLPICSLFCSFPSFPLLPLSILAKVRFRCSQFIAHSEREIQKSRRESEKTKQNKKLEWRFLGGSLTASILRLKL